MDNVEAGPSRRALLTAAGATGVMVALAGCSAYGEGGGGGDVATPGGAPAPGGGATTSTSGAGSDPGAGAGGGTAIAQLADIPVGGGKIFADRKIVVTQPQQGTIKAFTAVCTHQGCTVAEIAGGTINCPCHGSKFKVADGSVAKGPATKALAPVAVSVTGTAITLT